LPIEITVNPLQALDQEGDRLADVGAVRTDGVLESIALGVDHLGDLLTARQQRIEPRSLLVG